MSLRDWPRACLHSLVRIIAPFACTPPVYARSLPLNRTA